MAPPRCPRTQRIRGKRWATPLNTSLAARDRAGLERRALLGFAQCFFEHRYDRYLWKRADWAVRLAKLVFIHRKSERSRVVRYLRDVDTPEVDQFLISILEEPFAAKPDPWTTFRREPGLRAEAAIALGFHRDPRVKPLVLDILKRDLNRPDRAGYELTLALLGDPDFLNGPKHSLQVVRAMHSEFPTLTFDFTAKVEHLLKRGDDLAEFGESGCLFIITAVESLSDRVLTILDKFSPFSRSCRLVLWGWRPVRRRITGRARFGRWVMRFA